MSRRDDPVTLRWDIGALRKRVALLERQVGELIKLVTALSESREKEGT